MTTVWLVREFNEGIEEQLLTSLPEYFKQDYDEITADDNEGYYTTGYRAAEVPAHLVAIMEAGWQAEREIREIFRNRS